MSIALTGCKSSDYKEAVTREETRDFEGALVIFNSLEDYKDFADHASNCQATIELPLVTFNNNTHSSKFR